MKVLVLHEKHAVRIIDATSEFDAARHVVRERVETGQWYESRSTEIAEKALRRFAEQPGLVRDFLLQRSRAGHEYERAEFVEVEEVECGS